MSCLGHNTYILCYLLWVDVYGFVKCMRSLEDLNGEKYSKQILTMQLADAK